jgi:hypothetical protein
MFNSQLFFDILLYFPSMKGKMLYYEISMVFVCVSVFQILNQLADLHGTLREPYAIRGDSNAILVNFELRYNNTASAKIFSVGNTERHLLKGRAIIDRNFSWLDSPSGSRLPHFSGFKITLN